MKKRVVGVFSLCLLVFFAGSAAAAYNMISNPGFELGSGSSATTDWDVLGEVYREAWAYQSGTYGMAFYGWEYMGGIFFQDIACGGNIPLYYRMMSKYESLFPNHYFYQIITFYNSSSQVLGSHTNYINITSSNRNHWYTNACNYISPGATVRARVEIHMPNQSSIGNGAVFVDNMLLLPYTNTYRYGVTTESFVYDDSKEHPLHGENWGHGWSNAWSTSGKNVFIEPDSLGQIINYPIYFGSKLALNPSSGTSDYAQRSFSPITAGKMYASFEMTYSNQHAGDWCGAYMLDNTTEKFFWGETISNFNRMGVTSASGTQESLASGYSDSGYGNEYIVIACYDFDSGKLKFARYDKLLYNLPLQEPANWHATLQLDPEQISSLNGIKLSAGGSISTPQKCYFDEVRIATNWWNLLKIAPQDPAASASNMSFSAVTTNAMTLSWQRGNGEGVLVVARASSTPANPSDGSTYSASSLFGHGSHLGSSSYAVYQGSGTNVTVTGLSPDTLYYFSVFEFNGQNSEIRYNTTDEPTAYQNTSGQPEITLLGPSGAPIYDGDTTPSASDGTDFGNVLVSGTTSRVFTIRNDGHQNLVISNIALSGNTTDYSVNEPTSSTIASGVSTTFEVTCSPTSTGTAPVTIVIHNNDSNENPFTFNMHANALDSYLSFSTNTITFECYRDEDDSIGTQLHSYAPYAIYFTNHITYHAGANWLWASPTTGNFSSPGSRNITLSPSQNGIQPGSYTATLMTKSEVPNSAAQLDVTFNYLELPLPRNARIEQLSPTSNRLAWQPSERFTNVLILHCAGTAPTTDPSQFSSYSTGNTIGNATVIYKGSATSFVHAVDSATADDYAIYTINNDRAYSPVTRLSMDAGDDDTLPPSIGPALSSVPASMINNLLTNPGFESDSTPWEGWEHDAEGQFTGSTTNLTHSGTSSGFIGFGTGSASYYQCITNYDGAGIPWQASAWVSRESAVDDGRYLALKFYNHANQIIHGVTNNYSLPPYRQWDNISLSATSPSGTAYAAIAAYASGAAGQEISNICVLAIDDAVVQTPRPLSIMLGNTAVAASGSHINSLFTLTDGDVATVSTSRKLNIVFGAYDTGSGLSRGTTDPASQMNISIENWITNNVIRYAAAASSPYSETFNTGATSTWSFSSVPANLFGRTNAITATLFDNDNDQAGDQQYLNGQRYGCLTVSDDDTTPPTLEHLHLFGSGGSSNQMYAGDLVDGSWTFTGSVYDAQSGVNLNGSSTTQPNCSPYYQLVSPDGITRLTAVFDRQDFSDGGATAPAGISRAYHATISSPPTGTWTAYVYAADNDLDRGTADQLVATTSFPFEVLEDINIPPSINLPGPHILPVGSSTNFSVTGSDPDSHSFSLFMTIAPAGATYFASKVNWNATPAFCGTTNRFEFVINDGQGFPDSIITNITTITVPHDHDSDSLADSWEWVNFTTLAYGPHDDPDQDGADNQHEFIAGTSPDNNLDRFIITNRVSSTISEMTLYVATRPGKTYTIEYSDQTPATNSPWQTFTQNGTYTESGSGESYPFVDTFNAASSGSAPVDGRRYYRIRVKDE